MQTSVGVVFVRTEKNSCSRLQLPCAYAVRQLASSSEAAGLLVENCKLQLEFLHCIARLHLQIPDCISCVAHCFISILCETINLPDAAALVKLYYYL